MSVKNLEKIMQIGNDEYYIIIESLGENLGSVQSAYSLFCEREREWQSQTST